MPEHVGGDVFFNVEAFDIFFDHESYGLFGKPAVEPVEEEIFREPDLLLKILEIAVNGLSGLGAADRNNSFLIALSHNPDGGFVKVHT